MTGRGPGGSRWPGAALYLAAWGPALALCFYAKARVLETGGLRVIARSRGLVGRSDLGLAEILGLYREDALLCLVLLPVLLLLVLRVLGPRLRLLVAGAGGLLLYVALFAQMLAREHVGRYLSLPLIGSAFEFAGGVPGAAGGYLDAHTLLKLCVPAAIAVGAALVAFRADRRGARRAGRAILRLGLPLGAAATLLLFLPGGARTPFHRSTLEKVANALSGRADGRAFAESSDAELRAAYRRLATLPDGPPDERFRGRAADHDVILFVAETGPARCLDVEGDLADFPALRRLRSSSFTAARHHTTYPYTNRAFFSLLSSWYPSALPRSMNDQLPDLEVRGLPRALADRGYARAIYSPDPLTFEDDERMYRALGVDRFVYADPGLAGGSDPDRYPVLDRAVLERLLEDVDRWIREDRRYLACFLPQIGHAPWPDPGGRGRTGVVDRGRAMLELQDAYLGEIVRRLETRGRLEKTLILFTADHGVRTRVEDPDFHGGRIDAYSFHVPLLLFAPSAVGGWTRLPHLTSHVDVTPSLLDLLGVEPLVPPQGSPMWDPRLGDRTTFFFANHYLGADGYHRAGTVVMRADVAGEVYSRRGELSFRSGDQLPPDHPLSLGATERIQSMIDLQQEWVRRFGVARPGR